MQILVEKLIRESLWIDADVADCPFCKDCEQHCEEHKKIWKNKLKIILEPGASYVCCEYCYTKGPHGSNYLDAVRIWNKWTEQSEIS